MGEDSRLSIRERGSVPCSFPCVQYHLGLQVFQVRRQAQQMAFTLSLHKPSEIESLKANILLGPTDRLFAYSGERDH